MEIAPEPELRLSSQNVERGESRGKRRLEKKASRKVADRAAGRTR